MREVDILYENATHWVARAPKGWKGFEVYRKGITHSTRCAVIGFEGDPGFQRAKAEADRRHDEQMPRRGDLPPSNLRLLTKAEHDDVHRTIDRAVR